MFLLVWSQPTRPIIDVCSGMPMGHGDVAFGKQHLFAFRHRSVFGSLLFPVSFLHKSTQYTNILHGTILVNISNICVLCTNWFCWFLIWFVEIAPADCSCSWATSGGPSRRGGAGWSVESWVWERDLGRASSYAGTLKTPDTWKWTATFGRLSASKLFEGCNVSWITSSRGQHIYNMSSCLGRETCHIWSVHKWKTSVKTSGQE